MLVVAKGGQAEGLKVGAQDVPGPLVPADGPTGQVVQCLPLRGGQVLADGLGFTDEHVGAEHVDIAAVAGRRSNRFVFEEGELLGDDTELTQQIAPERLGVSLLRPAQLAWTERVELRSPAGRECIKTPSNRTSVQRCEG